MPKTPCQKGTFSFSQRPHGLQVNPTERKHAANEHANRPNERQTPYPWPSKAGTTLPERDLHLPERCTFSRRTWTSTVVHFRHAQVC